MPVLTRRSPDRLVVALHDVTPVHLARLIRAEGVLEAARLSDVVYLYVPRFHGATDAADDAAFVEWCLRPRPYQVRWLLHGYFHQDLGGGATPTLPVRLARRFMTAGEGEFAALTAGEAAARLELGIASFTRLFGRAPDGFVAPAWLWRPDCLAVLRGRAIRFTEDHSHLYDLERGCRVACPVITWSSRTAARRAASTYVCRGLAWCWRRRDVIRVAVHPGDFDHEVTAADIGSLLTGLTRTRINVALEAALGLPVP